MQVFFRTIFSGSCDYAQDWIESRSVHFLAREPPVENLEDIVNLLFGEWLALWDTVPFLKALPAARARGMLGYKNRMVPHGRLLPVVGRIGWRQSLRNKITSVLQDGFNTFLLQIGCFFTGKLELAAKLRTS